MMHVYICIFLHFVIIMYYYVLLYSINLYYVLLLLLLPLGLNFQLDLASRGLQMTFTGFNDKLPAFVSYILQSLKSFKPIQATYNRYKEILQREFKSWYTQQPYYHASYYANLLSESCQFEITQFETTLNDKNIINLESISSQFITSILSKSFVTGLVIGK